MISFSIFFQFYFVQISFFPGNTVFEVIVLKYSDLNTLLENMPEANQFYNSLPNYVKSQISTRPQSVNSLESLKDYAQNLLRGDE